MCLGTEGMCKLRCWKTDHPDKAGLDMFMGFWFPQTAYAIFYRRLITGSNFEWDWFDLEERPLSAFKNAPTHWVPLP